LKCKGQQKGMEKNRWSLKFRIYSCSPRKNRLMTASGDRFLH
jgi:hypothetical protein